MPQRLKFLHLPSCIRRQPSSGQNRKIFQCNDKSHHHHTNQYFILCLNALLIPEFLTIQKPFQMSTVIPPSLMALFDCYQNRLVLKNVQLPSMRIMPSPWGLRGLRAAVLNGKVVVTGGTNGNKHANEVYL